MQKLEILDSLACARDVVKAHNECGSMRFRLWGIEAFTDGFKLAKTCKTSYMYHSNTDDVPKDANLARTLRRGKFSKSSKKQALFTKD